MSKLIISTCGTSLLTNGTDVKLRNLLMETANCKENDFNAENKQLIDKHIQTIQEQFRTMDLVNVKKISAELNGIITYYHDQIPTTSGLPDVHYLLVSDTYQGEQVGNIISNWLRAKGLQAQVHKISDLSTNNIDNFRLAMSELINWCKDIIEGYRENGYKIIFNLTGGFKSVQGFLQTVGMFYADECIYIFQFSSELIQIPRLPIKLDVEKVVGENLTIFRQLDSHLVVTREEASNIPETLLFIMEEDLKVILSEWGRLIWREAKPTYYREKLLSPLSNKLVYSQEFERNIRDLQRQNLPHKIKLVNERCDDLSRFLDTGDNIRRLDYKSLTNSPYSDSTHECDAWSCENAYRLFIHRLNNGQQMIDRLAGGLH